jgi:hypothetical protein
MVVAVLNIGDTEIILSELQIHHRLRRLKRLDGFHDVVPLVVDLPFDDFA